MEIDLQKIRADENFMVHEHIISGETCYLIQPVHIGCAWTRDNCISRSSLWDSNGRPVSLSWKKFVNWGEKPEVFPIPTNIRDCNLYLKEDGSTLVFSLFRDQILARTRGTVDARKMANGHEVDEILEKYPNIEMLLRMNSSDGNSFISIIFEWVSSENVIVIKYDETPDAILTGIINHSDYSYWAQDILDSLAESAGLRRPKVYSFDSLPQMLESLPSMDGIEGLCVYHSNDQEIHKIKTESYLRMHRFKSSANIETTVDLFFSFGCPDYSTFEQKLIETFDYECFSMVRGFISNICDAWKEVSKICRYMESYVQELKNAKYSRKDSALKILL